MDQQDGRTPAPPAPSKGQRWRSGVVAVGAALGMTLAGLGIAGAQTGGAGDDRPAARAERMHEPGHKPGHHGGRRHMRPGRRLAVAAAAIGVSPSELRQALRSGQSMAEVARSRGVDVQKVVDALVADATAELTARVTEMVNRTRRS